MTAIIIIGILTLLTIYLIVAYNSFIGSSNKVKDAFATMDVYLKKRWDLVPDIVETVKGYARHEKKTLEDVAKIRSSIYNTLTVDDKIDVNRRLTSGMSRLMAVVEKYPDLKADQNFVDLNKQLSKIEDDIAFSRKYYNAAVKHLNDKVQMFPSNVIADIFNFTEQKMFEAFEPER